MKIPALDSLVRSAERELMLAKIMPIANKYVCACVDLDYLAKILENELKKEYDNLSFECSVNIKRHELLIRIYK